MYYLSKHGCSSNIKKVTHEVENIGSYIDHISIKFTSLHETFISIALKLPITDYFPTILHINLNNKIKQNNENTYFQQYLIAIK